MAWDTPPPHGGRRVPCPSAMLAPTLTQHPHSYGPLLTLHCEASPANKWCQGEARTPLELQELNAPAQPCPLLPRRCVGRVLVQRGCEASPGPCGGPGRSAPRLQEGTSTAPLPTEGCWSSCPNENKIRRFSAVLTAMLKSSHFPTKERPSEKPKQTLTQATLEVGLSYKHRKLNTKPCYNSTEDLT